MTTLVALDLRFLEMVTHVSLHGRLLQEHFFANRTLERAFPGVRYHVHLQAFRVHVLSVAERALEHFLPGVDVQVGQII